MRLKRFLLLFALFLLFLPKSWAEIYSIAVDSFKSETVAISSSEAEVITELYTAELVETGRVSVVDMGASRKVLDDTSFGAGDWENSEKTSALGNSLSATLISRGKIMKLGSIFYLSATLRDAETAKIKSSAKIEFSSIEELPSLLKDFAKELVSGLSIKIGDIGLGGGYVFYIEGDRGLECSEILGEGNWSEAVEMCKNFRGGGYDNWRLPTKDELSYIYSNLRKMEKIACDDWYWSSTRFNRYYAWGQLFSTGYQGCDDMEKPNAVRAVRSFSLIQE